MKHNSITILTMRSDTTPSPTPALIADLVEAVLRVPGLRVKTVSVANLESEPESVTRRIREVKAKRESLQDAFTKAKLLQKDV